jgi:uncharacterized protein YjiS (DUF1127 family)
MITIKRQTKRIAILLDSAMTSCGELPDFSDRTLRDIGLSRYRDRGVSCKPFWMA